MGIFNKSGELGETPTKLSQSDVDNGSNDGYVTGKTYVESRVIQDLKKRLNLIQDPVFYYSTLAHNNSSSVDFKTIPDSMTPGCFNAQGGDLIFDIPGVYQITYIDNYKSDNTTTLNIRLDDTDLDGILHILDVPLPKSVRWNLLNYTITVPIATYCSLRMSLNTGVLNGTTNSKLIIYKISDFPSDVIP